MLSVSENDLVGMFNGIHVISVEIASDLIHICQDQIVAIMGTPDQSANYSVTVK